MAKPYIPYAGEFSTFTVLQARRWLSNYLNFNGADGGGMISHNNISLRYTKQEVERYGNRTISGFLRMVGAELPMTSDQVVWSEQNRLHISYDNVACNQNVSNHVTCWRCKRITAPNMTVVIIDKAKPSATVTDGYRTGNGAAQTGVNQTATVYPYVAANLAGRLSATGAVSTICLWI